MKAINWSELTSVINEYITTNIQYYHENVCGEVPVLIHFLVTVSWNGFYHWFFLPKNYGRLLQSTHRISYQIELKPVHKIFPQTSNFQNPKLQNSTHWRQLMGKLLSFVSNYNFFSHYWVGKSKLKYIEKIFRISSYGKPISTKLNNDVHLVHSYGFWLPLT